MRLKNRRLLAVFAHPDDESFFCGGSIAKAARAGADIHLISATRGEDGEWHDNPLFVDETPELPHSVKDAAKERELAQTREKELAEAADVLGIKRIEYLSYVDGCLCNRDVPEIRAKIKEKISKYRPDVVLTFDPYGVTGHIDHVVMAQAAIDAVEEENSVRRLYFWIVPPEFIKKIDERKPGYLKPFYGDLPIVQYDINDTWLLRKKAITAHQTQKGDWERLMPLWEELPKVEYFKLALEREAEEYREIPFF